MNSTPVSVFFFKGTPSPPLPSIPFALLAASDYCKVVWLRGSLGDRGQWASPLLSVHPPPHVHFRRLLSVFLVRRRGQAGSSPSRRRPRRRRGRYQDEKHLCAGSPLFPPLLPCIQLPPPPQTTATTACCPFPCPPAAAPQPVRRFGGDFSPDRREELPIASSTLLSDGGGGRRQRTVGRRDKNQEEREGNLKKEAALRTAADISQCGSILYPR